MLRLRCMREADLPQVRQIERVSHLLPWPATCFRQALRRRWSCWTMDDRGAVAGYAVMSMGKGWAHILNMTVSPAHRRQGLGSRMLGHLLLEAERAGLKGISLEVRPSNRAAIGLYRSAGFRRTGLQRHYYPGVPQGHEQAEPTGNT